MPGWNEDLKDSLIDRLRAIHKEFEEVKFLGFRPTEPAPLVLTPVQWEYFSDILSFRLSGEMEDASSLNLDDESHEGSTPS